MALSACKHRVSGSLSLPSRGPFHLSLTVLLHYRSPSSIQPYGMVPAFSYKIPRVLHYSGYCRLNLSFIYQTFTIYGLLFQIILLDLLNGLCSPNPKSITTLSLGSSAFARHYSQNRFFFLFLQVLRCFSSLRSLLIHYFTYVWTTGQFIPVGFPHSDIYGLMNICFSPQLFAAYHVLLRLLVPRYSPYALCSLTSKIIICFALLCRSHSKRGHIQTYAPLPFEFRAPCITRI